MRIGSLFSGIGGLELGLELAGVGNVVWQVEIDPFPRSVLARHWPNVDRSVTDVRLAGPSTLAAVDVICGGFPCQDISYAGKGEGLAGERSGLWYEYARVVREMEPRFVVVENVAALATRGLDAVLGTLADLGYDAEWRSIRASDVGAPHRRERLFIVAHRAREFKERPESAGDRGRQSEAAPRNRGCAMADADAIGLCDASTVGELDGERSPEPGWDRRWQTASIAEPLMGRDSHGFSDWVDRWPSCPREAQQEWEPPRTCEGGDNRAARLKALGNAVVPAVAREVGLWLLAIAEREGIVLTLG